MTAEDHASTLASSHAGEHGANAEGLHERIGDVNANRVRRLIQDARQRTEQAEAERDAAERKCEMAERAAQRDFFDAMTDQRDALKAELAEARAAIGQACERLDWLIAMGFGARTDTLVDLRAALDTPTAPESPDHANNHASSHGEHRGVVDPGEPDEGPWCHACDEPYPCTEARESPQEPRTEETGRG